jgi:hypothetical protein
MDVRIYHNESEFRRIRDITGLNTIGGNIKYSGLNWKSVKDNPGDFALFTDNFLDTSLIKKDKSKFKVGLILEPVEIDSSILRKLSECSTHLDLILTYDERIIKKFSQSRPYSPGGTLFGNQDNLFVPPKKRKISIVASSKKMTDGHKLRHEIITKYGQDFDIDVYGQGYSPFSDRSDPYLDYEYTIVIENVKYQKHYFTEKLIDPLLLECIPIYWGTSDIGKFFDKKGIKEFNSLIELEEILLSIRESQDLIDSESLKNNKKLAIDFMSKEWNIQRVLNKHFNGIELPALSSVIHDYSSFVKGELDFEGAEPIDFAGSSFRSASEIGLNPRTGFLAFVKNKFKARQDQFDRFKHST